METLAKIVGVSGKAYTKYPKSLKRLIICASAVVLPAQGPPPIAYR